MIPADREARLERARREYEAAFDGVVDWVLDLVAVLAPMSLREEADLVKARLKAAFREDRAAEIDHVTALLLARDLLTARAARETARVLAELEARVAKLEQQHTVTYHPGASDPDDPTGRG